MIADGTDERTTVGRTVSVGSAVKLDHVTVTVLSAGRGNVRLVIDGAMEIKTQPAGRKSRRRKFRRVD